MKARVKQICIICIGWIFLVLGVVGLFLPFLQGILFIFVGIACLSVSSVRLQKYLFAVGERHPKFGKHHQRAHAFIKRLFRLDL